MIESESFKAASPQSYSSDSSSSSNAFSPKDIYAKTLFKYLNNNNNNLEYLALEDFTLKFPENELPLYDELPDSSKAKRIKTKSSHSNLNMKYLFLRNIRDARLAPNQASSLKSFLEIQYNLTTLDLIGIYLGSDFICSILVYLNNLK